MIESCMFDCPREVLEKGLLACARMREARALIVSSEDEDAKGFAAPLDTLCLCYETSLWGVVDYHGLSHLQEHYLASLRTSALLRRAQQEIVLSRSEAAARLRGLLEEAAQAVEDAGRQCAVRPSTTTLLGGGPAQRWEAGMREALAEVDEAAETDSDVEESPKDPVDVWESRMRDALAPSEARSSSDSEESCPEDW